MDYSRLTIFVGNIDKAIFLFCLILSVFVLLTVFLQEKFLEKRILQLIRVKSKLRSLADQGRTALRRVCPVIIEKTSPEDFLDLTRSKSSFMPAEFAEDLRTCFVESGKTGNLEKMASSRGIPKWQRIGALVSLGYAQDTQALDILKNALAQKDTDISYYALLSLAQLKTNEAARVLLDHLARKRSDNRKIASCLENFPPAIIDELIRATASNNDSVRFWAVRIMRKFKDPRCFNRVMELARDPNPEVRASSCECLGELGNPRAESALRKCLDDNTWFVRLRAVRSLNNLFGEKILGLIEPLKKDKHWIIRDTVEKISAAYERPKGS